MSSTNSRDRILDAALALITRRGDADVTMADIAKAARISRQAVYLHFTDRAELLVALARHADEKRGLADEVRKIENAPSGVAALSAMTALQARNNPRIWAVARALDAVRRTDEAAERSWQDRLQNRLAGCWRIVAAAADLLWTITSLRTWEDLVLQRGWTAAQYEKRVVALLEAALTAGFKPR